MLFQETKQFCFGGGIADPVVAVHDDPAAEFAPENRDKEFIRAMIPVERVIFSAPIRQRDGLKLSVRPPGDIRDRNIERKFCFEHSGHLNLRRLPVFAMATIDTGRQRRGGGDDQEQDAPVELFFSFHASTRIIFPALARHPRLGGLQKPSCGITLSLKQDRNKREVDFMPIFRYRCRRCGAEETKLVPRFDAAVSCESCGAEELDRKSVV